MTYVEGTSVGEKSDPPLRVRARTDFASSAEQIPADPDAKTCSACGSTRRSRDLWPSPVPNTGWFCRDETACDERREAGR